MDDLAHRLGVLDQAEEVRLLEVEAGGVCAERSAQRVQIDPSVLLRDHGQLRSGGKAVGLHDLDGLRIGAGGDKRLRALAILAHGDRLSSSRRAVIVRGVRHVHAGQLADHGLEFKGALQNALADFRLIRRVAGDKLLTGCDGANGGGNEVAVAACAAQNGLEHMVLFGKIRDLFAHLKLTQPLRKIERPPQQHLLRHIRVEVVHAMDADLLQHLLPLRRSGRNVRTHLSPPTRRRPRTRRRPEAPPLR